jgi:hypothetical protein
MSDADADAAAVDAIASGSQHMLIDPAGWLTDPGLLLPAGSIILARAKGTGRYS